MTTEKPESDEARRRTQLKDVLWAAVGVAGGILLALIFGDEIKKGSQNPAQTPPAIHHVPYRHFDVG